MLFTNFARLIDHAVREYQRARAEFLAYVDAKPGEQLGWIFVVQSHLETCVHAVHRAYRFAEALCRREEAPPVRKVELLSKGDQDRLRDFRNAQEHLEHEILGGKFKPGSARTVCVLDDRMEVKGEVITYVELRDWIATLHGLAHRLANTREDEG